MGAEGRVKRAQTRERGPPSAPTEFPYRSSSLEVVLTTYVSMGVQVTQSRITIQSRKDHAFDLNLYACSFPRHLPLKPEIRKVTNRVALVCVHFPEKCGHFLYIFSHEGSLNKNNSSCIGTQVFSKPIGKGIHIQFTYLWCIFNPLMFNKSVNKIWQRKSMKLCLKIFVVNFVEIYLLDNKTCLTDSREPSDV